jgi:broad specificity phosphatase PhoE
MMAKWLLLIRHAATVSSLSGRFLGNTDEEIIIPDSSATNQLSAMLDSFAPNRLLCSSLLRARQTAALLTEKSKLTTEIDNDLREINFGRWEKRTFEEISEQYPEAVDQWNSYAVDFSFPGGEKLAAFHERVHTVANRLAALPEKTVAVVTHGGVIRTMICYFLGLPPKQYLLFDIKPYGLSIICIFGKRGVLAGLNWGLTEMEDG